MTNLTHLTSLAILPIWPIWPILTIRAIRAVLARWDILGILTIMVILTPMTMYPSLALAAPARPAPASGPAIAAPSEPPEPLYYERPVTLTVDAAHPVRWLRFSARTKSEVSLAARRLDLLDGMRGRIALRLYRAAHHGAPRPVAEAEAPTEALLAALARERGEYLVSLAVTAGGGAPAVGASVRLALTCSARTDGACALAAQPDNPCGPRDPCDTGLVCKPSQGCRGGGVCVLPPRTCPPAGPCRAACGCDGRSYCSECEAERAGTVLAHEGQCTGLACGAHAACAAGDYCLLPPGGCEREDAAGTCRERPADCSRAAARPVCGCDGATWPSECAAAAAGVSVARSGPCPPRGACQADADCHGALPEICEVCRDGRTACAHLVCRAGRCLTEMCGE
jgi:hypothetical protein